jgi:mono/diheme cytochrome c family protein
MGMLNKALPVLAVAGFVALVGPSVQKAHARPNYLKQFTENYPQIKAAADTKCAICHMGDDKKMRNDFGKAVGEALGAKMVKDADKIKEALKKVTDSEKYKAKIEKGELPNS